MGYGGRTALVVVTTIRLGHLITAQPKHEIAGMGHWLDTLCVDRLQGLDEAENTIELPEHVRRFVCVQFESRQLGNAGDLCSGESQ
jgi:hypothetical protein